MSGEVSPPRGTPGTPVPAAAGGWEKRRGEWGTLAPPPPPGPPGPPLPVLTVGGRAVGPSQEVEGGEFVEMGLGSHRPAWGGGGGM